MKKQILLTFAAALFLAVPAIANDYKIMAPAGPGGGWDITARSMQMALQESGISKNVQVTNVNGAGGSIGLAQFVSQSKGDPQALIVGGYVMVGALITNNSPVTLDQVTPIAKLTGEQDVIVVPSASPFKTMQDLVAALKKDPGSVSWAGGSAGGMDHIITGMIAKAVGADPTKINYVAFSGGGEALAALLGGKVSSDISGYSEFAGQIIATGMITKAVGSDSTRISHFAFSGGVEALAALLGGQISAGISGYSEFAEQIKDGSLRLLAVSGRSRMSGVDAPTLTEAGVNVAIENWRMVAAASGITDEQKAAISADIALMVASKQWQDILKAKDWQNMYLSGTDFEKQLQSDIIQTRAILKEIGLAK